MKIEIGPLSTFSSSTNEVMLYDSIRILELLIRASTVACLCLQDYCTSSSRRSVCMLRIYRLTNLPIEDFTQLLGTACRFFTQSTTSTVTFEQ